jgi:hypothetical protein
MGTILALAQFYAKLVSSCSELRHGKPLVSGIIPYTHPSSGIAMLLWCSALMTCMHDQWVLGL